MHLTDMLRYRANPAAAVYLTITRRCPLSCAHCSTNSTMTSEEHSPEVFLNFARSFSSADHPHFILVTGGEPLLLPHLVQELTQIAHRVGTKVAVGSGMFFANMSSPPKNIMDAIDSADHFIVSLDTFHDREVPRARVVDTLKLLRDRGTSVSLQITKSSESDEYVNETIDVFRREFNDTIPMVVGNVTAVGRASQLTDLPQQDHPMAALEPCVLTNWPVVTFDGTIVACTNQLVVDGPAPTHLALGNAAEMTWPRLRDEVSQRYLLKALRVFGPRSIRKRLTPSACNHDYCSSCHSLAQVNSAAVEVLPGFQTGELDALLDLVQIQYENDSTRNVPHEYADLVLLGKIRHATSQTKEV